MKGETPSLAQMYIDVDQMYIHCIFLYDYNKVSFFSRCWEKCGQMHWDASGTDLQHVVSAAHVEPFVKAGGGNLAALH